MSESPLTTLTRALRFATLKHALHKRKDAEGLPYVNHLADVAARLAEATEGRDLTLLVAGLLHDVLEDTPTTPEELSEAFGTDVARIVSQVSDDKSLPKKVRKRLQIETAPQKTPRAKMIKLADLASNLQSIVEAPPVGWDSARKLEYFHWARQVAQGCRGVNAELEEDFDSFYRKGLEKLGSCSTSR